MNLEQDAKALLIFDISKGLTMSAVNEILSENNCLVVHVPDNHTNLFQPLHISVNKSAKCLLSENYQDWYAERVVDQLNRGVEPHNVKVDVKLSTVKPLQVRWVIDEVIKVIKGYHLVRVQKGPYY